MSLLTRLFHTRANVRDPIRPLWNRVVAIAREKDWYLEGGVADTVPGRFDVVTLVLALVMLRMEREQSLIVPSVHLTELFVDDMDGQLRQSGVGDLMVGKRMGKLMRVLGGRIAGLRDALTMHDVAAGHAALIEMLARNVTMIDGARPDHLAQQVRTLAAQLDATDDEALIAARIER